MQQVRRRRTTIETSALQHLIALIITVVLLAQALTSIASTEYSAGVRVRGAKAVDPPVHIHLSWQNATTTTVTITWQTVDQTANSTVHYGTTTSYGEIAEGNSSAGGSGVIHEVELTNLSSNTIYHYECGDTTAGWSVDHSFQTGLLGTDVPEFTFCVMGDSQTDNDATEFGSVVNAMRAVAPKFTLFTGDAVYDGADQTQWDGWFPRLEPLASNASFMPALGDHENNASNYYEQFVLPNNEQWYSFDWGNAHFICLNTETDETLGPGSMQYTWLQNELSAANSDPECAWKFVYLHRPPYSSGTAHGSQLDVRDAWGALFDQYHVDMVFSGHDHDYERTKPIYDGTVVSDPSEGTVYVVTGGAGAPLTTVTSSSWTAYSESAHHLCEVSVHSNNSLHLVARYDDGAAFDDVWIEKVGATKVNILRPVLAVPTIIDVGGAFTITVDSDATESSVWQVTAYTAYDSTQLTVTNAVSSIETWYLDVNVPSGTRADLYDLAVKADGASDAETNFKQAIDEINLIHPALVIITGDNADRVAGGSSDDEQYTQFRNGLLSLDVPVYVVTGNHDYGYRLWDNGIHYYQKYVTSIMDYSFDYGNYHFIGMDGGDKLSLTSLLGEGLFDSHINWLQNDLEAHQSATQKFAYFHFTAYDCDDDNSTSISRNRQTFIDLCLAYNVTHICGHTHRDEVYDRYGNKQLSDIAEPASPLFIQTASTCKGDNLRYRLFRLNGSDIESYTYDDDGNGIRDAASAIPAGNLNIEYSPANDGDATFIVATITNDLRERFKDAFIEFHVRSPTPGYKYVVENATLTDTIAGTAYQVRPDIEPLSTMQVTLKQVAVADDIGVAKIEFPYTATSYPEGYYEVEAVVQNYGSATQSDFEVCCEIENEFGALVFKSVAVVADTLYQNDQRTLTWGYDFAATHSYTISVKTLLADENPWDDERSVSIEVKPPGATVTLRIVHYYSTDTDEFLHDTDHETYFKLRIGGWEYTTGLVAGENNPDNNYDCDVSFSATVTTDTVPISIEVWEEDDSSSDDHMDVGCGMGDYDCDVTYSVSTKIWWGDTSTTKAYGTGTGDTVIWFYIQSDVDNEVTGNYVTDVYDHYSGEKNYVGPGEYLGYLNATVDVDDHYKFYIGPSYLDAFVAVTLTPSAGTDFDLYLYDPYDLERDYSLNWDDEPDTVSCVLDSAGYWYVKAHRYSGSGTYRLAVELPTSLTIPLEAGWNFIGQPLYTHYDSAEALASAIDNCTKVAQWNTSANALDVHHRNSVENNFTIEDGYGYFIYVSDSTDLVIYGNLLTEVTMTLAPGWNSIGRHNATSITAETLGGSIANCTAVAYWDKLTGRFVVHRVGTDVSDFQIARAEGYLVFVTSASVWNNE